MSERSTPDPSPVHDEVAAVVGRARAAMAAIADYTQEQVDELVTAVAWAVVRKDRAESLAVADGRGIVFLQQGLIFMRTWRKGDALRALDEAVALVVAVLGT